MLRVILCRVISKLAANEEGFIWIQQDINFCLGVTQTENMSSSCLEADYKVEWWTERLLCVPVWRASVLHFHYLCCNCESAGCQNSIYLYVNSSVFMHELKELEATLTRRVTQIRGRKLLRVVKYIKIYLLSLINHFLASYLYEHVHVANKKFNIHSI